MPKLRRAAAILAIKTPHTINTYTSNTTTNTLFGVGSITKTFISAAILKLEAENKLNINDPIGKYFPEYPRWQHITIKQLLNMTSGIFNYMNDPAYKKDLNDNYQKSWNTNKLINVAYQHDDDFKPGTNWNYTNTSYLMLGKIIEQVTKKSLEGVLKAYFFTPFKLKHTYYFADTYPKNIFNKIAKGFYNGEVIKPSFPHNIGAASGGMLMTAADLMMWTNHLFVKKDVVPNKQLNEMLTTVSIPIGKIKPQDSAYGLGVTVSNVNKQKIIWYTGVTPYHTAIYLWQTSASKIIVAMASFNRKGDKNYDLLFPEKPLIKPLLF